MLTKAEQRIGEVEDHGLGCLAGIEGWERHAKYNELLDLKSFNKTLISDEIQLIRALPLSAGIFIAPKVPPAKTKVMIMGGIASVHAGDSYEFDIEIPCSGKPNLKKCVLPQEKSLYRTLLAIRRCYLGEEVSIEPTETFFRTKRKEYLEWIQVKREEYDESHKRGIELPADKINLSGTVGYLYSPSLQELHNLKNPIRPVSDEKKAQFITDIQCVLENLTRICKYRSLEELLELIGKETSVNQYFLNYCKSFVKKMVLIKDKTRLNNMKKVFYFSIAKVFEKSEYSEIAILYFSFSLLASALVKDWVHCMQVLEKLGHIFYYKKLYHFGLNFYLLCKKIQNKKEIKMSQEAGEIMIEIKKKWCFREHKYLRIRVKKDDEVEAFKILVYTKEQLQKFPLHGNDKYVEFLALKSCKFADDVYKKEV